LRLAPTAHEAGKEAMPPPNRNFRIWR